MIEIITKDHLEEYESFVQGHPKGHFMQSFKWAKQKSMWDSEAIVCRDENQKIKGSALFLFRKVPYLPFTFMYCARGPVCDPDDLATLGELTKGAKESAKRHHAYLMKIDPDIPSSNTSFLSAMESLGYKHLPITQNFEGIQPCYVFRQNVKGLSEEDLMKQFHQKWRYNIRLAQRKGVEIRIAGKEAVPAFSEIMKETGSRDGFDVRPASYFSDMLDNLGENARLYMAYYEGKPIAGTIAIAYGNKVWYLYGASSNEHRNLMPNYLLQWSMMTWALERKADIYDFRGVSGNVSEDNPLYGLYRFKQGFGGDFTEFVGEFEYVFKPFWNVCINIGTKLLAARYFKSLEKK